MHYRRFGRTGLPVSEIGHGLWGMGGWSGSDDRESLKALQLSLDLGCTFFDSAWAYGAGKSDTLLGQLIKANPGRRIIAASKVPPKNHRWPASGKDALKDVFPRDHVFQVAQRIRKALGTDAIDLLQLHVWHDAWAEDESWRRTAEDLKKEGLVRWFGLSLNRWESSNGIAAIRTGAVDAVQVIYNLFEQAPVDALFPVCRELDVGVIARVPLDEGSLGGTFTRDTRFPKDDWRATYFGPENLGPTVERVERLKTLVPDGMTLPELALRFILECQDVHTQIVGMRKEKHVRANCGVSDGKKLPAELVRALRGHRWDRKVERWAD
jgi:aryl-alcohol dehydrogenase-like predicted oxidoreductase